MIRTNRSILHVVAHQDDDLYFMNPDLVRSLQDGDRTTTVVLTAGEDDGINADVNDPARHTVPADPAGYSTARGCGLRSAYARMATGDRSSPWQREVTELVHGFAVECFTLVARPAVRMYFFQLHAALTSPQGMRTGLYELWAGLTRTHPTLPVWGSALARVQHVSREAVIGALAALLAETKATTVRMLDPDPEHDGGKRDFVVSDHLDHTAAAQFTVAALEQSRGTAKRGPVVEPYRAYANRFWGQNLDAMELAEKADYLSVYMGLGSTHCPQGTCHQCGDRQLGTDPYRSTHMRSSAYRYSPGTDWLRLGPGGRLNAYGVFAGRLGFFTETGPATGVWQGPFMLGDEWISPSLALAGEPGGPAHVIGLRRRTADGGAVTVDLVHSVQSADGGGFSNWHSLENPDWTHEDLRRQRELGVPAAAVDGAGRLYVFARDFAQGISVRRQNDYGGWEPWESLGGRFLQDAGTAITTELGTVELYVPGKESVSRWHQKAVGGPFFSDNTLTTGTVATGGISAVNSGGGRVCLYYRQAATQQVMAYRQHENGRWPGSGAPLGGSGGTGPVAAVWAAQRGAREAYLAHRSARGRLCVSLPDREQDAAGPRWRESGGMFAQAPSLAYDAAGALVAAVIGTDGRLRVQRQLHPETGSPLGPAVTV
ncbi:PIG-L family deacetylase [Streptomyces sp. NPDC060028]|uniref:PIG-L family deacetylase n=1 Tax=Streptomyces sp. NPDC060028 TaxID=3347041 RepID=UPI0036759FB1